MLFDWCAPQLGWLLCFFWMCVVTLLSSLLLAVFVCWQSTIFGKQFFFFCSIFDTNCCGIQTTNPCLINMLTVFPMWLFVVLLLLQTMQHCHCCCFAQSCPVWHKMRAAFCTNWPSQKMVLGLKHKQNWVRVFGGECPWHARKRFPKNGYSIMLIDIMLMINIRGSQSWQWLKTAMFCWQKCFLRKINSQNVHSAKTVCLRAIFVRPRNGTKSWHLPQC